MPFINSSVSTTYTYIITFLSDVYLNLTVTTNRIPCETDHLTKIIKHLQFYPCARGFESYFLKSYKPVL